MLATRPTKKTNKSSSKAILTCILLVVFTLAVYWQVLSFDFIDLDDSKYVTENYDIQSGLTLSSIRWALTTLHAGLWQPLVWLSFMVDFEIYGLNPAGFHATNLVIHIINTVLFFLFLNLTTQTVWRSWFAAFFFALHPLHIESVAWIAERKDVLSTFFFMLILLSYNQYIKKPSFTRYGLVILLFIFGLASKAMLVSLPFLLLLLDIWPLGRTSFASVPVMRNNDHVQTPLYLFKEKIPFLIISFFFSIFTIFSEKTDAAVVSLASHHISLRVSNALISYVTYIRKMFFPYDLAVMYPFPSSISAPKTLGAAFLLLVLTWFAVKLRKSRPYITVGWIWYTVSLIPVIGLVQVGPQAMADRFTYIPLIGLFIICVWGFHEITTHVRLNKIYLIPSAFLIIFFYSALCWKQLSYWQNPVTLFTQTLKVTENNYVAHTVLGGVFSKQGKLKEAEANYRRALKIAPGYISAHLGYGITLAKMDKLQEAEFYFTEALKINPDIAAAHFNLGLSFYKRLLLDEAAYHFKQVLLQQPNNPKAHFYLGNILAEQGQMPAAIFHYKKAQSVLANDKKIQKNLKRAEAVLRKVN